MNKIFRLSLNDLSKDCEIGEILYDPNIKIAILTPDMLRIMREISLSSVDCEMLDYALMFRILDECYDCY